MALTGRQRRGEGGGEDVQGPRTSECERCMTKDRESQQRPLFRCGYMQMQSAQESRTACSIAKHLVSRDRRAARFSFAHADVKQLLAIAAALEQGSLSR